MPTPSWIDSNRWNQLLRGDDCPLCARVTRPDIAAQLRTCVVVVDERVSVPGYCCLILKQHAVELHHLDGETAAAFMNDIQDAARALQEITGAIKINYEIHGNVIPHIHMHLVPRYPGDAIERTGMAWSAIDEDVYEPDGFSAFSARLSAAFRDLST